MNLEHSLVVKHTIIRNMFFETCMLYMYMSQQSGQSSVFASRREFSVLLMDASSFLVNERKAFQ